MKGLKMQSKQLKNLENNSMDSTQTTDKCHRCKTRVPLTDDEIKKLLIEHAGMTVAFSEVDLRFARAIEAKHGIGVDK